MFDQTNNNTADQQPQEQEEEGVKQGQQANNTTWTQGKLRKIYFGYR